MTEYGAACEKLKNEFKIELDTLLKKYRATISADDYYPGYAECGSDIRVEIEFRKNVVLTHGTVDVVSDIDLGSYYTVD